jgi:HTH-type transcriptional regulator / antitoxin HigA
MSTTLADPAEMIHLGAPHLIHSDEELEGYTKALFRLTAKEETTPDEDEAIELLTLLIERYEADRYPVPAADPVTVLRYLMERRGLNQKDLIPEFGVESTISLVLSGKRQMNKDHIERLSHRFNVSPAVFFNYEPLGAARAALGAAGALGWLVSKTASVSSKKLK